MRTAISRALASSSQPASASLLGAPRGHLISKRDRRWNPRNHRSSLHGPAGFPYHLQHHQTGAAGVFYGGPGFVSKRGIGKTRVHAFNRSILTLRLAVNIPNYMTPRLAFMSPPSHVFSENFSSITWQCHVDDLKHSTRFRSYFIQPTIRAV